LGCIDLFPSYTSNGLIDEIKTVLYFDSPEQTVEFFLSVMDISIPFEVTWIQSFERGYQVAVISIPCGYLYHFLSGSDPSHNPSSTNWECFGRLKVSDNNVNYSFVSSLHLTYLVKLSDLDPNLANEVNISSSYPMIEVDPYGGDPVIPEIQNSPTSRSYNNSGLDLGYLISMMPYFMVLGSIGVGGLLVVSKIQTRMRKGKSLTRSPTKKVQFSQFSQKPQPKIPTGHSVAFCPNCGGVLLNIGIGNSRCAGCGKYFRK